MFQPVRSEVQYPLALEFGAQCTLQKDQGSHYFACYCLMNVVVIWLSQHCDDCSHPLAPKG